MLNLSNELFSALVRYLKGDCNIDQFRDYMVGLRVDKYNLLADIDRLFLNEFEGRYAEFADFDGDEASLKAALVSYVQADEPAAVSNAARFWTLSVEKSTGSFSMTIGAPSPSGNFMAPVVGHSIA